MKLPILFLALCIAKTSLAFAPNEVIVAEQVKRNVYVSDSMIYGGDALADPVNLRSIRWAKNPGGYERIVIDLGSEGSGWESKIPPYFQVGHDSRMNSISVSIRGVSGRNITTAGLSKAMNKSTIIGQSYLAPGVEGDLAAIEFKTRTPADVESFYLVNPPRIVLDIRAKR